MKCLFLILVFLSLNIKIEAKDMCLSASHLGCVINQKIDKTHMGGVCQYPGFERVVIKTNHLRRPGFLMNFWMRETGHQPGTLDNGYDVNVTNMEECTPTALEECSQDSDHPCAKTDDYEAAFAQLSTDIKSKADTSIINADLKRLWAAEHGLKNNDVKDTDGSRVVP